MSDREYYEQDSPEIRLRVWALGQMMWGAFIAGCIVFAIGMFLLLVWGLGQLLPEESKQAPSPYGAIEIVSTTTVV